MVECFAHKPEDLSLFSITHVKSRVWKHVLGSPVLWGWRQEDFSNSLTGQLSQISECQLESV